ncbi:phage major capsid protein [Dermabacteraceae bacterium P13138]
MNLMKERDDAARAISGIKSGAKGRELTAEEVEKVLDLDAELKRLDGLIVKQQKAAEVLTIFGGENAPTPDGPGTEPRSLGEYAVKSLGAGLAAIKNRRRAQVDTAEYPLGAKAAGDAHTLKVEGAGMVEPQIDKNIVHQFVQRPTIASWLGAGQLDSSSITYFVEKAYESGTHGKVGYVAENAKKPGLTFPDYEKVTENLKKIAAWIKISEEMAEDAPFIASEINSRLLLQVALFEEDALLNGDGDSGSGIKGILQRSGILTETASSASENLDAIHKAMTKIQTATGLRADGLVINPVDYEKLRLSKDGNGQYYAGGPFVGQYGNGLVPSDPAPWGLAPIITTAIAEGTALVGAGKVAATLYRKGGIRVEASNVDGEDFTHNRFTILAEMRELLAVRRPAGFAKITLGA